jgi:hypothetical protein
MELRLRFELQYAGRIITVAVNKFPLITLGRFFNLLFSTALKDR